MQITVGRIVHYYDEHGRGPIAAICVRVSRSSGALVDEGGAQLELHPWSTYAGPARFVDVPSEAGLGGDAGSWRWPPRE